MYSFFRIYIETVFRSNFRNAGVYFFKVISFAVVYTENYVLCGGKNVHQLKVLVNHTDFIIERVFRRANGRLFPVYEYFAFVRKIDTGNHIHKRSFSRTVFAEKRKYFLFIK